METLGKLKPAFARDAPEDVTDPVVTAGNASSMNDGASAVVVVSEEYARANGLTILARVTAYSTGAVDPKELFFAPIEAVKKLMKKSGTQIADYDLIEANEAFAVQALADGSGLGWDWDRVNVNGGAVALGHPIGASGARVLTTLLHALKDRGKETGLATLCLGRRRGRALRSSVSDDTEKRSLTELQRRARRGAGPAHPCHSVRGALFRVPTACAPGGGSRCGWGRGLALSSPGAGA